MRTMNKQRLAGAVCGALTLAGSQSAWALDKYLDIEPPQTLSGYGYGYNSVTRTHALKQCVTYGTATQDDGGAAGQDFKFSSVSTNDQLADEMGISVTTKFSLSMGVASVAASNKVDFFSKTATNFLTQTILASYYNVEGMRYISGDIKLKPEYLAMVGTAAFRNTCGDYFIVGEQKGNWFYGTVQLVVKDTSTESKLAQSGSLDGKYATASVSVNESTLSNMKSASSSSDLKIHVTSSGTSSNSLNIDQFLAQVHSFPNQSHAKQVYKLKAVPYEAIVANWPPSNPLAPLTSEDKLTILAGAAYGLIALIGDAEFVGYNAGQFAMGTTPAQRDARVAHVKARRTLYQNELNALRNEAKDCDTDWAGHASCEQLYNKWKSYTDFLAYEYTHFPARYISDCYASREPDLAGPLNIALNQTRGQFTNTKGDRQIGGSPVQLRAHLRFAPDFSGGDPLAARKLGASFGIALEEMEADHTTFKTEANAVTVFDLAVPPLAGGVPTTLSQCAYHGTGVKATEVADVNGNLFHGVLRQTTGADATKVTFTGGAKGVLTSLQCTVDGPSSNDTGIIGCGPATLTSVQMDLVNTEDLNADGWVKPATEATHLPSLPKVAPGLLGNLLGSRAKARTVMRACVAPMVNVGGTCVPVLKR